MGRRPLRKPSVFSIDRYERIGSVLGKAETKNDGVRDVHVVTFFTVGDNP